MVLSYGTSNYGSLRPGSAPGNFRPGSAPGNFRPGSASGSMRGPPTRRISRRSGRPLELRKKEAPNIPPPAPQKKEKWPHVFQRIAEKKEYHALEDYYWFYEEWNSINQRFVQKFGKRLQDVLMELQHIYRVKLENRVVMDNVKTEEDLFPMNDEWEATLHGAPHEVKTKSWRGWKFPDTKLIPDWKLVERIGDADKVQPVLKFFEHSDAHLKKRKKEWERWEKYCASMAERLRKEEPHYPEFPYLKVFGESLRKREPRVHPFVCKEEQKVHKSSSKGCPKHRVYNEYPWAYLSNPGPLHFACKPCEVTGNMVTLENIGNTALFFRWERRPMENLGATTPRRTLGAHITNCRNFAVMNGSGSVLPGQAREFLFSFRSEVEGYFMESWVLRVVPKLRRPFKPLYLKGVATLKELNRKLYDKFTQALNYRELMRGIGENLEFIQERALKLSRPSEEFRQTEYQYSSLAFDFIKINLPMEPPVYFIPSVYKKLDVLARAVGNELRDQPPIEEEVPASDDLVRKPGSWREPSSPSQDQTQKPGSLRKSSSPSRDQTKKPGSVRKSRSPSRHHLKKPGSLRKSRSPSRHHPKRPGSLRKSRSPSRHHSKKPGSLRKSRSPSRDQTKKPGSLRKSRSPSRNQTKKPGSLRKSSSPSRDQTRKSGSLRKSSSPSRDQIDASKVSDHFSGLSPFDRTLVALLGRTQTTEAAAPFVTSEEAAAQVPVQDVWNGSVEAISDGIGMIQDEWICGQAQDQYDKLLSLAQIPPHQTTLLHFTMYYTLYSLAGAVEEIFERVTEISIRPAAEQLVQSFYATYLRETAEKEREDLLLAERIKETGSMQEKSDLVDFWEAEVKHEVVAASPAENQEMLTYCFKWIQIMSELRCTMPDGVNHYQADVERTQAAVMDRMAQHIAGTAADDETKCWSIFSLERHMLELTKELIRLPIMS